MRLNEDGQYLRTAVNEKPVVRFAFWYRGISAAAAGVTLRIMGYDKELERWTLIETLPVTDFGEVYETVDFPYEYYAMGIEVSCYNGGSVVIDDVEIEYADATRVAVEGFDGLQLTECNTTVEGLMPESKYYYRVRAFNGELYSKFSNEVPVQTSSGICNLSEIKGVSVRQYAGAVYVTSDNSMPLKAMLYTMQGSCVGQYDIKMGTTCINLPVAGVYVLRIGDTSYKVVK